MKSLVWALVPFLFAQPVPNQSSFEIASVKPHKDATFSRDPFVQGRRVTGSACTLNDLIVYAYAVRYEELSGGPPWAGSDHYDIEAKASGEGPLPIVQARDMMKSLLADRFQLKVHREMQEVPVYALVIGKNGPKLKSIMADATGGIVTRGTEKGLRMEATKGTMEQLARQLSTTAGRPVLDKTGLSGHYAYVLEWFPANRVPPPDLETPSMFAAVQEQLGLKLEATRGAIEKLIVDHVANPSEN